MGSRVEIAWEEGVNFFEAWWFFAAEREKTAFRSARDHGAIETRRLLMQADLIERLRGGNLIAIGIRVQPDGDATPHEIPTQLFNSNVELVRRIFSRNDDCVVLSGRKWSHVFVHEPAVISAKSATPLLLPPPEEPQSDVEVKAKSGRPRIDQQLNEVVLKLFNEGKLLNVLRKEQVYRVQERARSDHPSLFPKTTQPSRTKVLAALKRVLEGPKST